MSQSQRVLSGSVTKGSQAHVVYPSEYSGSNSIDRYRQGIECVLIDHSYKYVGLKIHPHNDFLKIRDGKIQQDNRIFDDTHSPTNIAVPIGENSDDYNGIITFNDTNTASGLKDAINHEHDRRDLGQSMQYQDGEVYDDIITGDPTDIIYTPYVADSSLDPYYRQERIVSNDGRIEAYPINNLLKRLTNEYPAPFRGLKADMQIIDSAGNSFIMEQQTQINSIRIVSSSSLRRSGIQRRRDYLDCVTYFYDNPKFLGLGELSEPISLLGTLKYEYLHVSPYKDSSDNEERVNNVHDDVEQLLMRTMLQSSSSNNDFFSRNHVSTTAGYVYNNAEFVTDSLAYGGLKK